MYRLALRALVGQMVASGRNLVWSIEGGRTRTGKLRPPRYGLLRYVTDAVQSVESEQTLAVPVSIIFDQLPEDHIVQMFVTINAKHTRLNASHLVSLSGRQLYRDDNLAAAHDVVRALNDREDSPLHEQIKLLGAAA